MATTRGVFLSQLKSAVRYAKIRRGWAAGRLADAERQVKAAQSDLKRWTRPERKRKRAKK